MDGGEAPFIHHGPESNRSHNLEHTMNKKCVSGEKTMLMIVRVTERDLRSISRTPALGR